MSWTNSYTHTLALGLDRFGAAIFFNQPDITISSLCWIVRSAAPSLPLLKLYGWQSLALKAIGSGLEFMSHGHCQRAALSDIASNAKAADLLGAHYV